MRDPVEAFDVPDIPSTLQVRGATSVLGDLATIASGRLAAAVLSLATALITTRMLGPAGYGTVALVGVASTLIFTVSTAWTGISVGRYGREDLEHLGHMNRLTWGRALIGAPLLAISIGTLLGLKALGVLSSVFTWDLVLITVATGAMTIVIDHWGCLLETSGQMKVSAVGRVLSQAAYVIALLVLLVLGLHVSPEIVLLLALGSAVLLAIGAAPFVWKVGVVPIDIDRALLRRMLWLSTPMIGLMASQYIFGSIDIIVLRLFSSTTEVGIYAVAYQAYTVLSAAAVTATAVLVPLFVSLKVAGKHAIIDRYFIAGVPQGLLLISVSSGLAITPVPLLVPIVFGQEFAAAATPMAVLIVGLAFLFASYLAAPVLTLHEQTRATAIINAIAMAINVAIDFLLVGVLQMGVVGPAVSTTVALAFVFSAFYVRARQVLGVKAAIDLALIAPLAMGLAPALLLEGLAGMLVGVAGVGLSCAAILAWRSPFSHDDAYLIAKLDLPAPIKRLAIGAILRLTPTAATDPEVPR